MPSAVPSKVTKQTSNATTAAVETGNAQQFTDASQAIEESIKNKIRNLEKRKAKLDSYDQDLKKGKTLTKDQQEAATHIGEVEQQLDSMRELLKTIQEIIKQHNKKLKAEKKSEQKERVQAEIGRIRDLLRIQDILSTLGNDAVRKDFLTGANGALVLKEEELQKIDELFQKLCPCHEDLKEDQSWTTLLNDGSFTTYSFLTNSANAVSFYEGMTYRDLRALIDKIADCGYFSGKLGRSQSPEQAKSEAASTISNAEDNARVGSEQADDRHSSTAMGQHINQTGNVASFNGGAAGGTVPVISTPSNLIGQGGHANVSFLQDDQSVTGGYATNAAAFDPSAMNAQMPYQADPLALGLSNFNPASSALIFGQQQQPNVSSAQLSGYIAFEQPVQFVGGGAGSDQASFHMKQLDPNAPTFVSQANMIYGTTVVPASSQMHKEAVTTQYFGSSPVESQRMSQELNADDNNPVDGTNRAQRFGSGPGGRGGGYNAGRGGRGGGSYRGGRMDGGQGRTNEGGYRGRGGGYRGGYRSDDYNGQGRGGRGGGSGFNRRGGGYESRGGRGGGYRGGRGGAVEA